MSQPSILVLDDEPAMRLALSHTLRRKGYAVASAASGSEALDMIDRDNYQLLITDMKMPEMSGLQVLARAKAIAPRVRVVVMTAYGTVSNAVAAMREGAADYLLKPFSTEALEETISKVLARIDHPRQGDALSGGRRSQTDDDEIVTQDRQMQQVMQIAKNIAPTEATALILGESGTGKELLAAYIHRNSGLADRPYITVNCAALPENLAESELFGYEKGAFTGAACRRIGKFELAHRGSLLLDEISEMPLSLQAKLLRVLQEKEIDRVGGASPIPIETRIIATSNIDLRKAVYDGRFREDLYYRINVIPLELPPLRKRRADIALLAEHFLRRLSRSSSHKNIGLSPEALALLTRYDWPGNVRELKNVLERAVLMGNEPIVRPDHLSIEPSTPPAMASGSVQVGLSVKAMERRLIMQTLNEVKGNRTRAAEMLGISIRTLRNKLHEYRHEG
jgi:DNA-binding NtrC family response regulator